MKKLLILFLISVGVFIFPVKVNAVSCGDVFDCTRSDIQCPAVCPAKSFSGDQCSCGNVASSPLNIGGKTISSPVKFNTIGEVISALIPFIFVIAGLILFGLLISNGYSYLTSGGDPKKTEGAKGGITAALVGFIIIIASYWIIQILEFILKINILNF